MTNPTAYTLNGVYAAVDEYVKVITSKQFLLQNLVFHYDNVEYFVNASFCS